MRVKIALASCFVVLLIINASIYNKETLLADGETVFLKLAPVDPRSLMQGDYMALRFEVANDVFKNLNTQEQSNSVTGNIVVSLDDKKIGSFKRFENSEALASNERYMQYRVRDNRVKFATNAFFFEEGKAHVYEKAKYGLFRVSRKGELLLTDLYDEKLSLLQ